MKIQLRPIITIATLCIVLVGCGKMAANNSGMASSTNSPVGTTSLKGQKAFVDGFYAFGKTQGCVACHSASTQPLISNGDSTAAYNAAKGNQPGTTTPLIDFKSPATSIIVTYAGNNHCGSNVCAGATVAKQAQDLLTAWATAELADLQPPTGGIDPTTTKFVSASLPIPTNIPALNIATPAVLRFQLSALVPAVPALSKAILEVEIQMINPTQYRVNRPKIVGNTALVNVQGIHVLVKTASESGIGAEDPNQGTAWDNFTGSVAIAATPSPLPVGPLTATPMQTNALAIYSPSSAAGLATLADVMTISFDSIK